MDIYTRIAATALKLLTKFGGPVVLRSYNLGDGEYDPNTGTTLISGTDGANDEPRTALILDQPGSQISQRFGNNQQPNSLIQKKEKWLYLDAEGSRPSIQDKIILNNTEFAIIDVQDIGPGGVPVVYLIVVRA